MTVYYNEFDPFAAAWLRELIKEGLIADGVVDERSIKDVRAADLRGFTQHHFFAGIGGWSYALRLAGWSDDTPVWTGSCPCQPFSAAGKRRGTDDERHLWPEFRRLIAECEPPVVFGEQVASKDGRQWLAGVRADLQALGYAVGGADLCAAGVGAPHIRQRLWWVADSLRGRAGDASAEGLGTQAAPDGEDGRLSRERLRLGVEGAIGDGLAFSEHAERRPECEVVAQAHRRHGFGRCSDVRGLADAYEGQRGRVADSEGREFNGQTTGRIESDGVVEPSGADSRLADADGGLTRHGGLQPRGQHGQQPEDGCVGVAQGDTNVARSQGRGLDAREHANQRAPWTTSVAIHCADGKFRRVPANEAGKPESALFPLAHGISNRVGTLRGAGNAIAPQVAAEFIRAFVESRVA